MCTFWFWKSQCNLRVVLLVQGCVCACFIIWYPRRYYWDQQCTFFKCLGLIVRAKRATLGTDNIFCPLFYMSYGSVILCILEVLILVLLLCASRPVLDAFMLVDINHTCEHYYLSCFQISLKVIIIIIHGLCLTNFIILMVCRRREPRRRVSLGSMVSSKYEFVYFLYISWDLKINGKMCYSFVHSHC
jgi:hypothetical protein